jgi:ABC-type Fe3+/spermidine/putrescine transport system ATPase subunit
MEPEAKPGPVRIELQDIVVRFGDILAADHVSLTVEPGEIVALLGPSGCGKTTTLRVMAGLQAYESGTLRFGSRVMNDVSPHRRNVGMVFQNYALFPHMTVRENVLFGLQMHRAPRDQRDTRVKRILELLRIAEFAEAFPDQLSGGQQQRAALARTLVVEPSVLLLDEPLSALDRQLRDAMRTELRSLLKAVKITTILVTHDQDEALTVADRVAVMRNGRIEQIGSPSAIYAKPETRFVADFIGQINYLSGIVEMADAEVAEIRLHATILTRAGHGGVAVGETVEVAIRPEAIAMVDQATDAAPAGWNNAVATVERTIFLGGLSIFHLRLPGGQAITVSQTQSARLGQAKPPRPGDEVRLLWPVEDAIVLRDAGGIGRK